MNCARCGTALDDGATFCGHCGAIVGAAYPAPSSPSAADRAPGIPTAGPGGHAETKRRQGLLRRVRGILFAPAAEWQAIEVERASARALYLGYVAPLAAIAPIAWFVGEVLIGMPVPIFGVVRIGFGEGIVGALLMYALAFVAVFAIARITDALAPSFGGARDAQRALALAAYGHTPAWLAGVLNALPAASGLALFASLWSLYALYVGLPLLMRCPKDKAAAYALTVAACAVVLFVVIGALTSCIGGWGPGLFR